VSHRNDQHSLIASIPILSAISMAKPALCCLLPARSMTSMTRISISLMGEEARPRPLKVAKARSLSFVQPVPALRRMVLNLKQVYKG